MKDLGEANVILGMKLIKSSKGITLSLSHSIKKMIKKFGYSNQKPISIPYDPSIHLKKNLGEPIDQLRFFQIIGSLLYVTNRTRPDIAYTIGRLSRLSKIQVNLISLLLKGYSDILKKPLIYLSYTLDTLRWLRVTVMKLDY